MSSNPLFVQTPIIATTSMSIANTGRDGSGQLYLVVTGSTNGTRIDWIQLKAEKTTVAGMIRFYINQNTSGSLAQNCLFDEIATSAITPSATVVSYKYTYYPPRPIILPSGSYFWASTEKATEDMNVIVFGGNF